MPGDIARGFHHVGDFARDVGEFASHTSHNTKEAVRGIVRKQSTLGSPKNSDRGSSSGRGSERGSERGSDLNGCVSLGDVKVSEGGREVGRDSGVY
jgi:hypothetical protein